MTDRKWSQRRRLLFLALAVPASWSPLIVLVSPMSLPTVILAVACAFAALGLACFVALDRRRTASWRAYQHRHALPRWGVPSLPILHTELNKDRTGKHGSEIA